MTVKYRTGDLFESGLPALAHGCNCAGVMGAGIAVEFRSRWPAMYAEYQRLGRASALRLGAVQVWREFSPDGEPGTVIFNLMTQEAPGAPAQLPAIEQAVTAMLLYAHSLELTAVGMPRIGAGLGGLKWPEVAKTIEAVAGPSDTLVTVFTLPAQEEEG